MAKKTRTENSILNFMSGLGGQFIKVLMGFVVRTVFIRTLGKAYLGINGLFSNILTMLSLTELGMDTAINYKLYAPLAQHDEKRVRVLMRFYRDSYRVVGAVIFLLGLCILPLLPVLIKEYEKLDALGINAAAVFLLMLGRNVVSYLFFAYRSAVVKADQHSYLFTLADYLIELATAAAEMLILLFTKNFMLYTACDIFFVVLRNFVFARIAKREYAYAFAPETERLSPAEIRDTFKSLGALFVYKVNDVVLKTTDNLVLSSFIGLPIVGMYSNYLVVYYAIRNILLRVYAAVRASAGNLFATTEVRRKYEFFQVMNFVSAIFYGTACVGVSVVADEMIETWIGTEYLIPQPFSTLMGIELVFVGLKLNLNQIRNIGGAFRQGWWRPLMGIVINLTASIAAVKPFGICGVLAGTICADFFADFLFDPIIIHKYVLENYRPVREYYFKNAQYALVLLASGALCSFLCRHILVGYGWLSVLAHTAICGLCVPAAFVLCFHNRQEFRYLVAKLRPLKLKLLKLVRK